MKKLLLFCSLVAIVAITACSKKEETGALSNESVPMTINLSTSGISFSDLPESRSDDGGSDLLAIQIYQIIEDVETPIAKGLFEDWSSLSFTGFSNMTYKVEATLVVDATTKIYTDEDGVYGSPFNTAIATDFEYTDVAFEGISSGAANIITTGVNNEYATPNIDRYYGYTQKTVTEEDSKISTLLKRMSFGIEMESTSTNYNSVSFFRLSIANAPDIYIERSEVINIFSFSDLKTAYNADETSMPYSEEMEVSIYISNTQIRVFSGTVGFQRNKLVTITTNDADNGLEFQLESAFEDAETEPAVEYITKVFDYLPAPGQFVNLLPAYAEGDTQESMNEKVLTSIGNGGSTAITLGGYGGYVTVGFNHTIQNVEGKRDFRVLGNGAGEAGIIMVSADTNGNGTPDDEWYEIAGSAHIDHTAETWYQSAVAAGNDTYFHYQDFEITYTLPESEPSSDGYSTYIPWTDNKENNGYYAKSYFKSQAQYPLWYDGETLVFTGSRLPQNTVGSTQNNFSYGYADNVGNTYDNSAIDISWAIDSNGDSANLSGVDFVRVYTGVNQTISSTSGECSTEIAGVVDLHVQGVDIDSDTVN